MSTPDQLYAIMSVVSVFVFIGLLVLAIVLIYNIDLCDNHTCKAFDDATAKGEPGSKEYTLALIESVGGDGFWPIAFIGAIFITFFLAVGQLINTDIASLWVVFLLTFFIMYALNNFAIHHYFRPIADAIEDSIINSDVTWNDDITEITTVDETDVPTE